MKKISFEVLALFFLVFILMSFSKTKSDYVRGSVAAVLRPSWEYLQGIFSKSSKKADESEMERLKIENERLKGVLSQLKKQKGQELAAKATMDCDVIAGKVIFRPPSSFDSSLWINIGEKENKRLGKDILMKNSPVVVGNSLIGVVDYVGKGQSRVRLITDPGLNPAVRVFRETLEGGFYLAKGELRGAIAGGNYILKGVGFNCDFEDAKGPARDLRTGKCINGKNPALPIIKVNDLLITSGLDGVFPVGLHVGKVTKIYPLKEGDYYYEIEASPAATNLHDLTHVFILSPSGFDPEDIHKQIE